MPLRLYNTLTKAKEDFVPLDAANVRMYVCGPTVYDFAHIGNARPAIVFDVLFRLLRHTYGDAHVTYARNITDVDDKINARAAERGISIRELTEETARIYDEDIAALGCLRPSVTPRATEHIAQMIAIIEKLIAAGHAYEADGHVLFDVASKPDYGKLARRSLDEMIAGARVDVASYKKGEMDFVLWKPSDAATPGWEAPWGRGRPGWHIECSAMAGQYLGETFDIHGGGIDLMFPHHENEIAQSEGAHHGHPLAKVWMHNGFLQVEGEKMSKSLGNFFTIRDLLETDKFGGRKWPGNILRLAMLMTHYRQPIDWTQDRLQEAQTRLYRWHNSLGELGVPEDGNPSPDFIEILSDDLDTTTALSVLDDMAAKLRSRGPLDFNQLANDFAATMLWLGIASNEDFDEARAESAELKSTIRAARFGLDKSEIDNKIEQRTIAKKAKDFAESDRIRDDLLSKGIVLKDGPQGTTWEVKR